MLFVWFCVFVSAFIGRFVTEQSPFAGGCHEIPLTDTDVLEAARFAVDEFNKANTEDPFNYAILEITSADIKVVEGFNYFLEMLLGRATCKTGNAAAVKGNAAVDKCDSNAEPKEFKCNFTVNVIPWKESHVLLRKKCKTTTNSVTAN